MHIDIKDFLEEADIKEALYPGKRIVHACKHIGDFKNHCVVLDWRDPDVLKINVKPGLSGKTLAPEVIKNYPVCLQSDTFVTIEVTNDNESDEDDEEEKGKKGKSGGGGKKMAKKKLEDIEMISARFGDKAENTIPSLGEIKEMVVMGVEIAKEAFGTAFAEMTNQIKHAKVSATQILAKAADMVTKVKPPSFMEAKGDETVSYKYDREKNADIGMKMTLG